MKTFCINQTNAAALFILVCLIAILIKFCVQFVLLDTELIYAHFDDRLSVERINDLLELREEWGWLAYVLIPPLYIVKFILISGCLMTGIIISGIKVRFNDLFKWITVGEIIFLARELSKIVWFRVFEVDYTYSDLQNFSPFSLINVFNVSDLDRWAIYPIQFITLFQVMYVLFLAYGVYLSSKESFLKSLAATGFSYLTGVFMWLTLITFITINLGGV